MRWAVITFDNIVDNVVIWNGGESLWPEMITVQLEDNEPCSPGWLYDPNATPRFIEPITPDPVPE
jgi:hypothetical protein